MGTLRQTPGHTYRGHSKARKRAVSPPSHFLSEPTISFVVCFGVCRYVILDGLALSVAPTPRKLGASAVANTQKFPVGESRCPPRDSPTFAARRTRRLQLLLLV